MIRIKRNIVLLLCPVFLAGTPLTIVFADEYEQGIVEKEKKIEDLHIEKQDVISKKEELENQISLLSAEAENVLKQKTDGEQKINELTQKINVLQRKISNRENQLRTQARDIQVKQGKPSVIEVIINSESLSDAVKKTVLNAGKNILEQQNKDKTELESLEKEANQHLNLINEKTIELKEKQEELVQLKLDKDVQINTIDAQASIEEKEKQKFEAQKEESEKKRALALKELENQKIQEQKAREQAEKQAQVAADNAKIAAQEEVTKAEKQASLAKTAAEKKIAEETQLEAHHKQELAKKQQDQVNTVTDLGANHEVILPEQETNESNVDVAPNADNESNTYATVNTNSEQNKVDAENPTVVPPHTINSGWASPLNQALIVTSPFGLREDPTGSSGSGHDGVDLAGAAGTPIHASKPGTVVESGFHWSAGNHVVIKHSDGHYSYYMHMINLPSVQVGQIVDTGQVLGAMGTTGNSTGVHLHFGISNSLWSDFINPQPLLGI